MIGFVNAKINIGLQIVNRREDGYHDLQTLFYPVGLYAGTAANDTAFCDVLEIVPCDSPDLPFSVGLSGRKVDCEIKDNLVYRAAGLFFKRGVPEGFKARIMLEKHLPDGAGMGGGSADAAFTLSMLRDVASEYAAAHDCDWTAPDDDELAAMALSLGADCPFFLLNAPAYAEGVGERLVPVDLDLSGRWLVVVKPSVSISTKEAFAGVVPCRPDFDLKRLGDLPLNEWKSFVKNDFEKSIYPGHPEFQFIKESLYGHGAAYASLTGSGSCLYGIFEERGQADKAVSFFKDVPTIQATYLLKM